MIYVDRMKQEAVQATVEKEIVLLRQKIGLKTLFRKALLLVTLTGISVIGRIVLQGVPSVETITPFSILSGFILGPVYGFVAGVSGFYASNYFVFGGQGPWTIFQCLGAGLAGLLAGLIGKIKKSYELFMLSSGIGIVIYEIMVNLGWSLMFGPSMIIFFFITSLPFSVMHFLSTLVFASIFWKFKDILPRNIRLIEKEAYKIKIKDGREIYIEKLKKKKKRGAEPSTAQ